MYVLLRWSELGYKENDYYEKPLFFQTREEAFQSYIDWHEFLVAYSCSGDAYIAELVFF